ncbi:MAG: PAS domain S-box protein [Myxococcales bacterium]|nr:PAS domain S-box protein [Myxococcales bacterium]
MGADLTEAARLRLALRQTEHLFASIFEASPMGLAIADLDGACVRVNAAFAHMLGVTPAELIGHHYTSRVHPDETQTWLRSLDKVRRGELAECRAEVRYGHANGHLVPIELRITRVVDPDGAPLSLLVWATDLTERLRNETNRRSLEAQVHQAERLESLGVLVGGIAHDFNNLLTGMLANADCLLEDLAPDTELRACAADIREAAHQAAALTHQMLAYGGKARLVTEPVELRVLVHAMGRLLRASVPRGVKIELRSSPSEPEVRADPTQMRQIVMNLVLNAVDAVAEGGGHIVVSTGLLECGATELARCLPQPLRPGTYAFVEVTDDGCGMDAETQSRVFEPFFTTKKFRGRGLGLSALPREGDLVLLAFIGGDLNAPVALGSIYDDSHRPPVGGPEEVVYQPPDDEASGVRRLHVELPNGALLTVEDEVVRVEAGDTTVAINTDGDVEVSAAGNLKLVTKGDLTLEADGNVKVSARGDLGLSAMGQATVEGTAATTVKGPTIKLAGMTQFSPS